MPEGAVYVGRPTKWGNPHVVGGKLWHITHGTESSASYTVITAEMAVDLYREYALKMYDKEELEELRGKDLVCWCSLDQPCHVDVLLELANE